MHDLLPPWPLFWAFMAASLLLAITPGPGVIYIVTRGALHGRRHGMASVLGVAAGNLANAIAAALGLAALFAISSLAFSIVKYAGAAYLIWLGCRMLFASGAAPRGPATPAAPLTHVFRDGLLVAALNPKTMLFFAAFLPQFLGAEAHRLAAPLLLGTIFVGLAAVTDSLYALAAASLAPRFARHGAGRLGRYAGGGLLVGLGAIAALSEARSGRRAPV